MARRAPPYTVHVPSTQPIKAARGVRDILPSERVGWSLVERAAAAAAERYGYEEIETPVLEPVGLIERGVGGDTDVVRKEMFRIEPHGEDGTRLVLRPEATAGIVRAYFEGGLNQGPQPARLYTIGPMFRHDRPQKGRYRQFYQFDVEVLGDPSAAYDAEVIELTLGWLTDLGLSGVTLELNSIGDQVCRPRYLQALRDYYRPLKDQLHPDCQRRVEDNPLRLLDCKEPRCLPFKEAAPKTLDYLCGPCEAAFAEVRRLLDAAGIEYRLNPYLVRGLDYYTRTVFELQHQSLGGAQNALGGGGRYDGLAAALGYPDTPGVGFAGGLDRVVTMLREEGHDLPGRSGPRLLVLPDADDLEVAAAQVAREARRVTSAAPDYSRRSLRAKMRAAARSGARWVAIMNAEEAARHVVQLRDMESGEQREVAWDRLAPAVATPPPAASDLAGPPG
jgi:histidyl-tRNA synthetase